MDRAVKLAEPVFRQKNLEIVRKILQNNNYPIGLIETIIKRRIHDLYSIEAEKRKELRIEALSQEKMLSYYHI